MFSLDEFKNDLTSSLDEAGLGFFSDGGDLIIINNGVKLNLIGLRVGDTEYLELPAIDLRLLYAQNRSNIEPLLCCSELICAVVDSAREAFDAQTKK